MRINVSFLTFVLRLKLLLDIHSTPVITNEIGKLREALYKREHVVIRLDPPLEQILLIQHQNNRRLVEILVINHMIEQFNRFQHAILAKLRWIDHKGHQQLDNIISDNVDQTVQCNLDLQRVQVALLFVDNRFRIRTQRRHKNERSHIIKAVHPFGAFVDAVVDFVVDVVKNERIVSHTDSRLAQMVIFAVLPFELAALKADNVGVGGQVIGVVAQSLNGARAQEVFDAVVDEVFVMIVVIVAIGDEVLDDRLLRQDLNVGHDIVAVVHVERVDVVVVAQVDVQQDLRDLLTDLRQFVRVFVLSETAQYLLHGEDEIFVNLCLHCHALRLCEASAVQHFETVK
eukprot:CAMPEP_0197035642 /NCGR_PEP_ID=MMETSP1384-20130603/13380_1 /TAXON_ID=29189 /ORGANISM="Ammonia sp." /LENGTH=342 /DNA_ID=CAMNT_0042465729 /DNA_START=136 /DNA_END=1164 /DNA_ORIENTATION=+